jgi:hypothetical protein
MLSSRFAVYLFILCASAIIGITRITRFNRAAKYLLLLIICTVASEYIAHYAGVTYRNNMPVYHIFAPLQFFLVGVYYNYNIDTFKRNNIGIYIGIAGVILSILNSLFLQPINTFNTYFLLFSGFSIISMSLYSFYRILENEEVELFKNPHFWFSSILLFFWSTTYINWSLYRILELKKIKVLPFIGTSLWIINLITYTAIGLAFMFYPRKSVSR